MANVFAPPRAQLLKSVRWELLAGGDRCVQERALPMVTSWSIARCRKLVADQSGLAAIEFALILPIMMLLLFGTVELGDALTINDKVNFVTSTLGDLVTQSKSITDTDMANIFNAAGSIITPYPVSNLRMIVSGVNIDANSNATVAW